MKFQKWLIAVIFVSIIFFSFSICSANVDNVTSCSIGSKDAIVTDVIGMFQQFHKNQNNQFEGIVDKDVIWKYEGVVGAVPFAGTYNGKEGVKRFWRSYLNSVLVTKFELSYYLHQGNIIHLHWIEEGIVKSTGKRYAMETLQRLEFNDKGKLIKLRWYNDTYALYQAFQPHTDPQLSIALHPADYNIKGDGPVDALTAVQNYCGEFLTGNLQPIINNTPANFVLILAGPENLTKIAGTRFGPQGLFDFFNTVFTYEKYNAFNLINFTTDGCKVDAEFHEEIVILDTGKVVDCDGVWTFVVNSNGQMAKFRSYNDTYSVAWGYIQD